MRHEMVAVADLPPVLVDRVAALKIHVGDIAVTKFVAFADFREAFGEFAARAKVVGHGHDVLVQRPLQEFEIILGGRILRLAHIGLIADDADAADDADDGNDN